MKFLCVRCKSRKPDLCKREFGPLLSKIRAQERVNLEAKQEFTGASPNVFVGQHGYPNVNVGILAGEHVGLEHDNPLLWSKENYSIDQVIGLRTSLVNSKFQANIKSFKQRFVDLSMEVGLAQKPVDVEVKLDKKPRFKLSFFQEVTPHGPSVKLIKSRITSNPKIPRKVDKAVSDTDLKANHALTALYRNGFDEHYLAKLLSTGNLGVKKQRKLVPTRWSITATDDALGKDLIARVQYYNQVDYQAYFGSYMGNYYLVLLFPGPWTYELFETSITSNESITDFEDHHGRKEYAYATAGGYYAARLGILERLNKLKRCGSALALRFITDEYWAPLGVWVVREAVRKAMQAKPLFFGDKEYMIKYAKALISKKFGYDISLILGRSKLLSCLEKQRTISEYKA
jgi:hypothetical protein